MTSPSISPEPEIPQFDLDTYTKTSTENNGNTKVKEVKSMKHDKSPYKVTEKKRYTFKYLPGSSRRYRTEAMDVDNKNDCAEMAKKIISETQENQDLH
ncbi:hypothetical protein BDR07DRAFT_1611276 [Suillus spraguei]|nr:hypothetical protein BDR07DRAFT_1611276 [Suillus spraguei]